MDFNSIIIAATKYAEKNKGILPYGCDPEDFGQEYAIKKLNGLSQPIRFAFIDYLRQHSGDKRSSGYNIRSSIQKPTSIDAMDGYDNYTGELRSDVEYRPDLDGSTIEFNSNSEDLIEKILYLPETRNKKIMIMKLRGASLNEISEKFCVHKSRVSQILKNVIQKIEYETLKEKFLESAKCY